MTAVLSDQDRAALTRLEEALWREETRFDIDFMQGALAPDFFEFGRAGRTYTREQTLAVPRQPTEAVLPLPDLKIRLIDENTAQITYNSAVTYDGVVEHGRRSSIWSRMQKGWAMRFHQGTPMCRDIRSRASSPERSRSGHRAARCLRFRYKLSGFTVHLVRWFARSERSRCMKAKKEKALAGARLTVAATDKPDAEAAAKLGYAPEH